MTTMHHSSTARTADVDVVRAGFQAVGAGDLAGFAAMFHPDATWNHRNADRLGGIKARHRRDPRVPRGVDGAHRRHAAPVPEIFMPDGAGHVAVLTRISATRPDGRTFDDTQILCFTLEDGSRSHVDQFIGDPPAVTAFWA